MREKGRRSGGKREKWRRESEVRRPWCGWGLRAVFRRHTKVGVWHVHLCTWMGNERRRKRRRRRRRKVRRGIDNAFASVGLALVLSVRGWVSRFWYHVQ